MSKRTRKRFTPQEKLAILRLHLLEHTPVSDLCDRQGIRPTMVYRWQKEVFENGAAALERRSKRTADLKEQRIAFLEEKLKRKNAAGLHDARRRRRRGQPLQRLPRPPGRLLASRGGKPSKKGQGFEQPLRPHEHWHVDVSYINVAGSFFYLCSLLDGCSRYIVHREIRERMTETDVETIVQRARERFPDARTRIISDNGPQFIAKDFAEYVAHYDDVRLPSAIGDITPKDRLEGRHGEIFAARERKLAEARARRAGVGHGRDAGLGRSDRDPGQQGPHQEDRLVCVQPVHRE